MQLLFSLSMILSLLSVGVKSLDLLVITVATEDNDGYFRFMRSADIFNHTVKVLGMNKEWKGGNLEHSTGGGQKVILLKEALLPFQDHKDLLILFSDSYDAVFTNGPDFIIQKFLSFGANIVFSSEGFCWPDKSLTNLYPEVPASEKRFLNSGGFIGYAPQLYQLVTHKEIHFTDDDQLFYTQIFLDVSLRTKLSITLDTKSQVFQNLNGALDEVIVKYGSDGGYLYNVRTGQQPAVIHGNGPIKSEFNSLTNYISHGWTPTLQCQQCAEHRINLEEVPRSNYPRLLLGLFVEQATPFLEEFFNRILNLSYPKAQVDLYIHCGVSYHASAARNFEGVARKAGYRSTLLVVDESAREDGRSGEAVAREQALGRTIEDEAIDFLVAVDSIAQLTAANTLELLVSANRSIVSPLLLRPKKLWSNFWGALSEDGYYARSDDYLDIISGVKSGLWNVPYIYSVYSMSRRAAKKLKGVYTTAEQQATSNADMDLMFTRAVRAKNLFMFVLNYAQLDFGHLVDPTTFNTSHLNNDLWEIFANPVDWEHRYLNSDYQRFTSPDIEMEDFEQPCTDVFWVPLVSNRFAADLIAEMEHFGQWSDGGNRDPRLEGGYENVPTRDIHMRQVDFEEHWLHFLRTYVYPIQVKLFAGYLDEPSARLNFVVRYKPDEQPSLRPHHDASSYTINIALNRANIDYQGGGCRFTRYNCKILESRVGWGLMHPGRVTHQHEGLTTVNGTRYIFITFVNP